MILEKEYVTKVQNERTVTKTRNCMVDLIRIIACLIVVGCHINNLVITSLDKTKILWGILFGDGVTIFLIMMGFFMFNNKSFVKLFKKTIKHILLPTMVVILLSELIFPWVNHLVSFSECIKNFTFDYKTVITRILNWQPTDYTAHLWYIFTYFKIILMFPILQAIVKDEKVNKYVILVTLGLMIYTDIVDLFNPTYRLTPFYFFEIAIMYPLLGYEIYKRKDDIKGNFKVRIIAIFVAIITQIIRYIMQYKLFETDIMKNNYVTWFTSFACIFSSCLIITVLSFDIKNAYVSKLISFVGQRTFVIYLIHIIVLAFLDTRGLSARVFEGLGYTAETNSAMSFLDEGLYLLIKIVIVFSISLLISIILHYLKVAIDKLFQKLKI